MQDWNACRDALLGRVGEYAKLSPDMMRDVQILDGGAASVGRRGDDALRWVHRRAYKGGGREGCIARGNRRGIGRGDRDERGRGAYLLGARA